MNKRNRHLLGRCRHILCGISKRGSGRKGRLCTQSGAGQDERLSTLLEVDAEQEDLEEGKSVFRDGILEEREAMGILLDEPKFPVIERAPSAATTISNFNLTDWLRVTAVTSASIPVGYLAGGSVNVRGPSMYTAGLIGLMGGFMFAYQCSAGRLMGMFPNDDEVARYKR